MPSTVKRLLLDRYTKNGGGSLKWGNSLNDMLAVGFGVSEYRDSRREGNGVVSSLTGAAGDIVLSGALGFKGYLALTALPGLGGAAIDAYDAVSSYGRGLQRQGRNVPFQNATFLDSQQTYTMRQAGMNLARQGKYAAQAAMLGNEAQSISYMGR